MKCTIKKSNKFIRNFFLKKMNVVCKLLLSFIAFILRENVCECIQLDWLQIISIFSFRLFNNIEFIRQGMYKIQVVAQMCVQMTECSKRKTCLKEILLGSSGHNSTQPFKLNSRIQLSTVCVQSTVHIAFSHRSRRRCCRHFCCYCRCRLAHFMRLGISLCVCTYPTAIKQYSTQFTHNISHLDVYRSHSFIRLLFSIYARACNIKYTYLCGGESIQTTCIKRRYNRFIHFSSRADLSRSCAFCCFPD